MKEIRVGILHSLSGSMASSEMHLVDAALFAIDEINKQGGVLGKQLRGVVEDGCSDPEIFKTKAEKLLEQDGVHVVSGCWTSSSRKAVQDIIQEKNVFLLYPVQYEGLEENPNILYSGSCLNQQISPAIEWCLTQGHENFYLVGSDYVFPRTANALIRSLLLDHGANVLGEDYLPLGDTDFKDITKSIKIAQPDFVINTINGESNAGFFTYYNKSGNEFPVMSFSISEQDFHNLGIQNASHYLCWSYFQNLDNKVNQRFLRDFGKHNNINQTASDPMVMTYSQIRLWSQAVEAAGSLDIEGVRTHLRGQRLKSPAGLLEVMPNNHLLKSAFIGKQVSGKKFEIVWKSEKRIKPKPWLGMEDVELPSAKLILDALAQYPNLIHLNTALQTANLELKKNKGELEKHEEHLEKLVEEKTTELAKSEERFRTLTQTATDAIISMGSDGQILFFNAAAEIIFGFPADEVIGKSLEILMPERYQARHRKAVRQFLETKKSRILRKTVELEGIRKDGTVFPIEVSFSKVEIAGEITFTGILRDISERVHMEKGLADHAHDLGERVKELNCLYGTSRLMEKEGLSMGEILRETVEIIPPGWHYPELTCARIVLRDDEYKTANFAETKWKQEADIDLNKEKIGVIEVYYLEEMPELDEGPFLKEERNLINAIAEMLGDEIDRKEQEEQIKRQIDRLSALREIDTAITGSFDLTLILDVLLRQVVSQLKVDAAAILLPGPNQNLKYAAHRGFKSAEKVKTARIRLGTSYAGLSALELRFVSLDDLEESQVPPEFTELLSSENFSSYFASPLAAKGQTLGVLEVYSRSHFSPDEDWKEFFETIAQQAAIAIDSVQLFDELRKSKTDLEVAYEATLAGWGKAIDLRDHDTEGHSQRVTDMTLDLAVALGVPQGKLINIARGALLHDIGKLGVPDAILLKPGKLNDDEWEIMHKHPVFAFEMLSQIAFLESAMDIPCSHHEKWDGTGYPRGLKGKEIPLAARIFAIVDVWDALLSDRPYRKALSSEKTLKYIREQSGKYFDPEIVTEFVAMITRRDYLN